MLRTVRRGGLLHQKHRIVGAPPVWWLPSSGLWLPWRFLKLFKIFGLVLGNISCTLMVGFFPPSSSSNWARLNTGLSLGPQQNFPPRELCAGRAILCIGLAKESQRDCTAELGTLQLTTLSPFPCFWHLETLTNVIPFFPSGGGVFPGPFQQVSRLCLQVANMQE